MRTRANITAVERAGSGGAVRAFTIVELLVAIGVVIVLLSLVVVAVNAGTRAAQRTNTAALMTSITTALAQFETDMGYLPPVLGPRDGDDPQSDPDVMRSIKERPDLLLRDATVEQKQAFQQWFSYTTIADYLIGYGPSRLGNDGKAWSPDGHGGFGIRHPGPDGYWGANTPRPNAGNLGTFGWRETFLDPDTTWRPHSAQYRQGQVYGPYLELRDERLIAGLIATDDPDNPFRTVFPGEPEYNDDLPKTVVDYWGEPIRYYRLPYPGNRLGQRYRPNLPPPNIPDPAQWRAPSLSDFFALRPFNLRAGEGADGLPDLAGDPSTTYRLQSARFGLLSTGPDRRAENEVRHDDHADPYDNEYNRDNIVEVGP